MEKISKKELMEKINLTDEEMEKVIGGAAAEGNDTLFDCPECSIGDGGKYKDIWDYYDACGTFNWMACVPACAAKLGIELVME